MLEYFHHAKACMLHSNPILTTILSMGKDYNDVTISPEGKVINHYGPRYLPELIVSIVLDTRTIHAISTEGVLYIASYETTRQNIPEPIVMIKKVCGILFAFTAEGVVYYQRDWDEWIRISVKKSIVNIIGDSHCAYLECSDGRWYSFHPSWSAEAMIFLMDKSIERIEIDAGEDERAHMVIKGDWYAV